MSDLFIRRVAILGASSTGRALAGHLTNLGFSVSLLDETNSAALDGVELVRPLLFVPERSLEIRAAAVDEETSGIEDADWIIDAYPERIEVKRELYPRIFARMKPDAVVTTCSSSLSLDNLTDGMADGFVRRYLAVTFSYPLADRRLAEVRGGNLTDVGLVEQVNDFLSNQVARKVVSPTGAEAALSARYGVWCLILAAQVAEKLRFDIEDVEAIVQTFIGDETNGIFRSIDGIGLDEIRDIAANLQTSFLTDKGSRFLNLTTAFVGLLARGWTGDKAGRGFFRREGREHLALNLSTMAYRQAKVSILPGLTAGNDRRPLVRLRFALAVRDEVGEFLREFLIPALRYAEYLRETTGCSVIEFDRVMELGFGWELGPFALLDGLGLAAQPYYDGSKYLSFDKSYISIPTDHDCQSLADCPIVEQNGHFTVRDLGDGIQAVVLSSGTLTPERIASLHAALERSSFDRFILTTEGPTSPELDLELLLKDFRLGEPFAAEAYLGSLQILGEKIESKNCVAVINGHATGPWLAFALSTPIIVASANTEIGFPEARLGILPTARALALMRSIHGESAKGLGEVVISLAEGIVAPNADIARQLGFLRPQDVVEYLPDRLLTTAKAQLAQASAIVRRPLPNPEGPLIGIIDRGLADRKSRGGLTDHDVAVGHRIRQVVARTATYEECLDRERSESIEIGSKALTQARLRHTLETGKPLRN